MLVLIGSMMMSGWNNVGEVSGWFLQPARSLISRLHITSPHLPFNQDRLEWETFHEAERPKGTKIRTSGGLSAKLKVQRHK